MTLGRTLDGAGNPIMSIDTESGRALAIYQTASAGSVGTHMHIEVLGEGTYTFILIDISDTDNYRHMGGTSFAHLQSLKLGISCDTQGEWIASFGFIEDVTETGCTEYIQDQWRGARSTGNDITEHDVPFPVGQQMSSDYLVTDKVSNSTDFQSNILVRSTLSPGVPDTLPGDGDVFFKLTVTAGEVKELKINIGYHSH